MKIALPETFIKIANERLFKSVLKVIKVGNNSTLIEIKGHQIDVPFVLNKDSRYFAIIKDGILNLDENKYQKLKESEINKINIKEMLDNILQIDEKSNNNIIINLFNIFQNKIKSDKDIKKKNNYFFKDKNNGLIFIFDITLFNKYVKLFLRFFGKNIFLFFYSKEIDKSIIDIFQIDLEKYLYEKYKELIFEIKFFDKKEKFYDNISVFISNIDIKI